MARVKTVFANGIEWVYDPEVEAAATHYGDSDGVQHPVVSSGPVADDTPTGFTEPNAKPAAKEPAPAEPAPAEPAPSGDFVPSG